MRSWSEGKRKNIRALLCSLDTVLWEGEKRWKKVGMHELVHADQVNKLNYWINVKCSPSSVDLCFELSFRSRYPTSCILRLLPGESLEMENDVPGRLECPNYILNWLSVSV